MGPATLIVFMVMVGAVVTVHAFQHLSAQDGWDSGGSFELGDFAPAGSFARKPVSLDQLRHDDPNFSQILLEDFLYELYARAHEARASADDLAHLAPYLDAKTRSRLATRGGRTVLAVGGVIVGSMSVSKLEVSDQWVAIEVVYEANYTETYPLDAAGRRGQGSDRLGFYAKERWHFVRKRGVLSPTPDQLRSFNCPSCGAPVADDQRETCGSCGATHGTGEFDWVCNGVRVLTEQTRGPALTSYAPEEGTFDSTIVDPTLALALGKLHDADPDFTEESFLARVEMIYHELNAAWSSLDWADARPFLSDRLWLSMRYWIHAYEEQSLQNLMLAAKVTRTQLAKVEVDPFFHSITVRVWATAKDTTIHRGTGAVVAGNADLPRRYSEYWTFIRSAQRRGKASTEASCPSCGAGLSINMAGNCEYCGVKITGGAFDWVLSTIEQDEVYRG